MVKQSRCNAISFERILKLALQYYKFERISLRIVTTYIKRSYLWTHIMAKHSELEQLFIFTRKTYKKTLRFFNIEKNEITYEK